MPRPAAVRQNLRMDPASQQITPELRRWIVEQAEAGCLPQDIVAAMHASGWREDTAVQALEQTLRDRLAAARAAVPAPAAVPDPQLDEGACEVVADGHPVQVLLAVRHPRLVLFGQLLTDRECDALIELARPRLERSETVVNATGASEVSAVRTSDGMFFGRGETPLIAHIERRIAALVRWPVDHGEGLQVLRYRPGAQYRPHHDYFDPAHAGTPAILARGGQRVATVVVYLNRPERGGATTFPDAGIEVAPQRGSAVFFSYARPQPGTATLHAGAPVLAGEKWVATKWLRQDVFR
jgi:prolyl 4-hydroxylase